LGEVEFLFAYCYSDTALLGAAVLTIIKRNRL
jgi:hypothetical protein